MGEKQTRSTFYMYKIFRRLKVEQKMAQYKLALFSQHCEDCDMPVAAFEKAFELQCKHEPLQQATAKLDSETRVVNALISMMDDGLNDPFFTNKKLYPHAGVVEKEIATKVHAAFMRGIDLEEV